MSRRRRATLWWLVPFIGTALATTACAGTNPGRPTTSPRAVTTAVSTTPTRDLRVSYFTNYGILAPQPGGAPACGLSSGEVTATTLADAIDSSGRVVATVRLGAPRVESIGGDMVECTFAFVFEGLPETGKRYAVAVEDLTWEFSAFDWHEYDWDVRIFDLVVP